MLLAGGFLFGQETVFDRALDNVPLVVHTGLVGQSTQDPELPVRFYRTEAGASPVLNWLRGLERDDRRTVGLDLMRVQFGWPIGRPLVGSLKNGLWEVRSTLPSQRIARLILCFHDQTLVVLHGFIKKTQKAPADDLALAKRRMREVTK
jgi:phage-related protein